MNFIAELKRRNVIRMAGLYLVGAWLIVQVSSTVLPMFNAPPWLPRSIVILIAVGFIPTLIFSWVFELTPSGLKRDEEVTPEESIAPQTARRMDRAIIVVLALALLYFGFDKFVLTPKREARELSAATQLGRSEAQAASSDKSIAVLPFVDMSEKHDQEYFSDGIAEELLNRLAQIPDLRVAARTSAFQFKGKNLDVADIGRQLKVANLLEGSVRKEGSRLRITAQLINSVSGMHLWSQTFEGDAGDVFKVQDDIATAIAKVLEAKLVSRRGSLKPTIAVDPQAYDDYLQGRAFFAHRNGDNLKLAVAAFDRAIVRDPNYAAAHAGRAFALAVSEIWTPWLPSAEVVVQSRASAGRALELDQDNVEALTARGVIGMDHLDIAGARADFERAHALAPDDVDALNFYGDFLLMLGDLRAAERMKRRAMVLDPLAWVHPNNLAIILFAQGRFEESLPMAEMGAASGFPNAAIFLMRTQLVLKKFDAAAKSVERVCSGKDDGSIWCRLTGRVWLLSATGHQEQARSALIDLLHKFPPQRGSQYSQVATISINCLNDIAMATQAVRKSLEGDSYNMTRPMSNNNRGALLPEEISRDPEWLAVWADPKLRPLMDEYRKNIIAFRKGG